MRRGATHSQSLLAKRGSVSHEHERVQEVLHPCLLRLHLFLRAGPHRILDAGGGVDPTLARDLPLLLEVIFSRIDELSAWVTAEVAAMTARHMRLCRTGVAGRTRRSCLTSDVLDLIRLEQP